MKIPTVSSDAMHRDLLAAQELAYKPSTLFCKNFAQEAESKEYGACEFIINNLRAKFRVGKITPTKIGHFVTLWKRIGNGPIIPHDLADPIDLFVVSVRNGDNFGQFVFPKTVLVQKGIVSQEGRGGKLAIRVYPPWDITQNAQAQKTQVWQLLYFFEIQTTLDTGKVQKLFIK